MRTLGILFVIAALGDEVTLGPKAIGRARPAPSYVDIIGRELDEPVLKAGTPGETSAGLSAQFGLPVLRQTPRVVLIMVGLNDASWIAPNLRPRTAPRVSEADFEKNLKVIVDRVKKANAKPVLLTPNPMTRAYKYQTLPFYQENDINDGLAPYADITRRVARLTGACLVDIFAKWQHQPEHRRWLSDGWHPNAEGHRRIAASVLETCGPVLKRISP
jgi:lysophospholipase L1-like esterase